MSNFDERPLTVSRWALLGAFLLGASVPLAFAPFEVFPLAVLAPALWFLLLRDTAPAVALRRGFAFGLGMFGAGVSWVYISIHYFGHSPLPAALGVMLLLVAYMSVFPAALAYVGARRRVHGARVFLLLLPAGWALAEWLRSWLFTGFAWLNLGYTQIDSPLAGYAPVLGVYGVSWLTALSAGLLAWALSTAGRARWLGPVLLALLWLGGAQLKHYAWTQVAGAPLRVSLIQGNIPQDEKWDPAQQVATLEKYLNLTRGEWSEQGRERLDLVIWPETAIPAFQHQVADNFLAPLTEEARRVGTDLLTGIPVLDRERWEYYNAVIGIGQDEGAYYKHHLVPFGEYLPLRKILGTLLQVMPLPVADFSAGKLGQPLVRAAGYPVGISICYEIIFGEEIIAQLPQAAFLVNVSNDAWFGDSLAPHQHLEMARMRALETGRYLLRATNTGITAIIGPDGTLRERGPQFETTVVRGSIEPRKGSTPYVRWGNWPVVIGATLVVPVAVFRRARPH
ncbi:MAG: apolipoprotein N-acyltransferase [Gammaproteobacteria bacterium]|nr:apolipoprotein N-acyltransferase [Gammaproteobacteria bacterium]